MTPGIDPDFNRLATLIRTHPAIAPIREAATTPLYLVGGAIRDALADFRVDDIDLVIEGDPVPLAAGFDPAAKVNDRFGTVNLLVDGYPVDIATARTETYSRPGALPDVRPGTLEDDLRRRDFTINAMAIGIDEGSEMIDQSAASPTWSQGCSGCSTTHPSRMTRPGRSGRPATPPAWTSTSNRRRPS